jgi:hypothetical protein
MMVEVRGRKYVKLERAVFVELPETAELQSEEFAEKVKRAYFVQVVCNGGWGFTVRHGAWRVRFDLPNSTGYKLPRIYTPCIEEEPKSIQQNLLEVC